MTLNHWFVPAGTVNNLLPMEHNHGIVLLSVLIAILTSAMALQLAGLARLSRTRNTRQLAIATGALAMGGGIWAMHFIGMLAMQLPVRFHYDLALTMLSMLPGMVAAWIALTLLAQKNPGRYPAGLAGTDIPIEARIVAIADVFDALTSERPYKKAWPVEQALQLLRDEAGKHFDPELVPLFIEQLPEVLNIKEQWAEERA